MQLLRKVASFTTNKQDILVIYKTFVRGALEQSCTVWHSSLTKEQQSDLERVQKSALKVIMGKNYQSYENACESLNIEDLSTRRTRLCLQFAKKCLYNNKIETPFPRSSRKSKIATRHQEKYKVKFARTERLRKSAIPYMQKLLNNCTLCNFSINERAKQYNHMKKEHTHQYL